MHAGNELRNTNKKKRATHNVIETIRTSLTLLNAHIYQYVLEMMEHFEVFHFISYSRRHIYYIIDKIVIFNQYEVNEGLLPVSTITSIRSILLANASRKLT